jgi:hypothetical protein
VLAVWLSWNGMECLGLWASRHAAGGCCVRSYPGSHSKKRQCFENQTPATCLALPVFIFMRYDLSLTIHPFPPTVHVYRYLFDRWPSTLLLLSGERRLCNAILLCHQWNLQRVCIHKIMLRPTDKYIYHFLFGNTIPIRWRKHSASDHALLTHHHATTHHKRERFTMLWHVARFSSPKTNRPRAY